MLLTFMFVFIAGVLQAGMQSLNGILQGYAGLFGTSLATHLSGGLLLILYIVLIQRERVKLGPMPLHLYSAGFFGLLLVAATSLCVSQIGTSLTTCLSISGQLVFSILMDHFGWMSSKRITFQPRRVLCLLTILAGLLIVNFGGQKGTAAAPGQASLFYILLALLMGAVTVYSKAVNFQATKYLGTFNGTLVNYVTASILSALLLITVEPDYADTAAFTATPVWLYLGGVCGVIAMIINVISLKKITLFQSTTLLLAGQLAGSALLDAVLFRSMSAPKLFGILIVAAGVIWDNKISSTGS